MLAPASTLKAALLTLQPTMDENEGVTNLVAIIANYMSTVQAGTGDPTIFALAQPQMANKLKTLTLTLTNSWVPIFAEAFQLGVESATVSQNTVTNILWTGSSNKDNKTPASGALAISTISTAISTLTSALYAAQSDSTAPLAVAQGIHDATLNFVFNCTGQGPEPILEPIVVPTPAQ